MDSTDHERVPLSYQSFNDMITHKVCFFKNYYCCYYYYYCYYFLKNLLRLSCGFIVNPLFPPLPSPSSSQDLHQAAFLVYANKQDQSDAMSAGMCVFVSLCVFVCLCVYVCMYGCLNV